MRQMIAIFHPGYGPVLQSMRRCIYCYYCIFAYVRLSRVFEETYTILLIERNLIGHTAQLTPQLAHPVKKISTSSDGSSFHADMTNCDPH